MQLMKLKLPIYAHLLELIENKEFDEKFVKISNAFDEEIARVCLTNNVHHLVHQSYS